MMKLVGSPFTRAFRVLWMLEELGEPYEFLPAPAQSDEARRYNPTGKVPSLEVDGTVLTDSTAILTYLADKHGKLTFPPGTLDRARQDGFTHFLLDEFDAVLWTSARHSFVLPEERRVPEVKPSLKWEFERSQQVLLDRMGDGPHLMGDTMTIADIIACHCVSWAIAAKFPLLDGVKAYSKRLTARPAFQRASAYRKT